jgi:hypothetical protein
MMSGDEKWASDNAGNAAQKCPSELSYVKSAITWDWSACRMNETNLRLTQQRTSKNSFANRRPDHFGVPDPWRCTFDKS